MEVKYIFLVWGVIMLACFLEAYFCSEFDPETKKFMKKREKESKNK